MKITVNLYAGHQAAFFMAGLILVFMANSVTAQDNVKSDKTIRQGNKLYKEKNYDAAELKYSEALEEIPTSEKCLFNQGSTYYQQEKFEEALQNFEITAEMFEDPVRKANAYHNIGNTWFKSQDLEKSIEAYKNALRLNPGDEDTRYNLAFAQNMLQQQNPQNQDQQQQEQEEEKEKNQEQQQQQGENEQGQQEQDQQQQDQEQQQQESGEQQGEDADEQNGQPVPQPSRLSKEEVQRILEALAIDENKVQEKIIKKKTKSNTLKIEKDW